MGRLEAERGGAGGRRAREMTKFVAVNEFRGLSTLALRVDR